jgi:hypothetical protein
MTSSNLLKKPKRPTVYNCMGGGLLTQKAFVPQNFDAGTLLLRHMGWLLTQGPLTRQKFNAGWLLTQFTFCMAFDAFFVHGI